jgi:hypothetical protein
MGTQLTGRAWWIGAAGANRWDKGVAGGDGVRDGCERPAESAGRLPEWRVMGAARRPRIVIRAAATYAPDRSSR